ncbi:MAG: response regulator transcription factor [Actinomycetota bacterium]|nr:MAG: two component transcriptional [Actinomycetota bacterium]MDO8950530.1 response regulator transcription factor [Actinomycetota bacterium]MDP3630799.1 response regulator transcription factor [Actinomycetota bacterium]
MRILLVEDEDRIASFMASGLTAEGHAVERAGTAAQALGMSFAHEYDLILLDLMLPDGDGREVLQAVRARNSDVPVVVLTALGEIDDKVALLDLGADDYLVKPIAFAELAARVRAAARHGQQSARALSSGELELDTKTRIATCGERSVDLPSREFALLEYLMRHAGQVLTRQQILDAVWGFGFESASNIVDVYVGYLRRKLDEPGRPSVIETVRGAGYRVRA